MTKSVAGPITDAFESAESAVNQRRHRILSLLAKTGSARTSDLSKALGVSQVSIRKDLRFLESRGYLRRTHGGARAQDDALSLLDLSERYMVNRKAKEAIVRRALTFLSKPNMQVYIDTGSTNLLLARGIPRDLPITVVTNSLSTVEALAGRPKCKVIALGGWVDYRLKVFLGPWAHEQVDSLRFDLLFAGADSVTQDGYCDDNDNVTQSQLLRKAISRTAAAYVLADSSKIGRRALNVYATLGEITGWITERLPDADLQAAVEANGGTIIVGEEDASPDRELQKGGDQ